MPIPIRIFGSHDERTIAQLERWPRLHGAGRAMSRTNAAGKGASATAAAC